MSGGRLLLRSKDRHQKKPAVDDKPGCGSFYSCITHSIKKEITLLDYWTTVHKHICVSPDFFVWIREKRNRELPNTCDMFGKLQSKKLKRLIFIGAAFTVLSLAALLSIYRPEETLWFLTRYHQAPSESQVPLQPTVFLRCGGGQTVSTGQMVPVIQTKTLLISAYQEHRRKEKEVRVIAVALRSESVAYRCFLCCQDQLHTSNGVSYIHKDHFNFAYATADIMCPIPPGCESPSHIAVISAKDNTQDKLDQKFLKVKNQNATKDSFPYTFTVCYSVMYNFTNVLQLVQSLELLQLLGVNRVVIYKTDCSQETESVLEYYTRRGLVEVIPWSLSKYLKVSRVWKPDRDPGDIHYFGQIPALNDCVYRSMYQSRYVALHDSDELILPQTVNSWSELLPLLEKKHGADKCYAFQNNVFPALQPPPASTPEQPQSWRTVPGVNILDHLRQYPIDPKSQCGNFKIIVNPRTVFVPTVHGLLIPSNFCPCVDRNIARMYHIRAPYESMATDKLVPDKRLLDYKGRLAPNVNTVLEESGLLKK